MCNRVVIRPPSHTEIPNLQKSAGFGIDFLPCCTPPTCKQALANLTLKLVNKMQAVHLQQSGVVLRGWFMTENDSFKAGWVDCLAAYLLIRLMLLQLSKCHSTQEPCSITFICIDQSLSEHWFNVIVQIIKAVFLLPNWVTYFIIKLQVIYVTIRDQPERNIVNAWKL